MSTATSPRHPTDASGPAAPTPAAALPESLVCFSVGDQTYALDVAVVREVVTLDKLLPVPRTAAAILGAFALRGATIAVVDSAALFGLPTAPAAAVVLVLARAHRTLCALTIDRVVGVVRFAIAQFTPSVRGREPPQVAGFLAVDHGELVTVLDTPTVLRSTERLRC
jgi:purine-binding chemotaxis protein CheW